jgi:hypothetical protein
VDAFVDDTAVDFTDGNDRWDYHGLIRRLQEISQTWEHLLYLSGWWSSESQELLLVCFILGLEKRTPETLRTRSTGPQVQLRKGAAHDTTPITRMDIQDSLTILGVHLSPSGDFGHHIKEM